MVRKEGIEPSLREPQSLVLPLHYIGDINKTLCIIAKCGARTHDIKLKRLALDQLS